MKYLVLSFILLIFGCAGSESNDSTSDVNGASGEKLESLVARKKAIVKDFVKKETIDSTAMDGTSVNSESMHKPIAKNVVEKKSSQKPEHVGEATKISTQKNVTTKKNISKDVKKKAVTKKAVKQNKKHKKTHKKPAHKSGAKITFENPEYDYGRIKPGDVVKHSFKFKNTGTSDLVISNAVASCGCTTPSFPFIPIAPGEEGYIGVVFDSSGKLGRQRPSITLTTNIGTKKVYLTGYVYDKLMNQ